MIKDFGLQNKTEREINLFFIKKSWFRFIKGKKSPEIWFREINKRKGSRNLLSKKEIQEFKYILEGKIQATEEDKKYIRKIKYLCEDLFQ